MDILYSAKLVGINGMNYSRRKDPCPIKKEEKDGILKKDCLVAVKAEESMPSRGQKELSLDLQEAARDQYQKEEISIH
ncbi:hypothetical protein TNIN_103421 [Trichonephila inaurata madagascariensis]|uniref:Uncharacterized protein n=1 Tax=Trichonephila inaurata madagascariensis TaxID=2747483 RepID=A0A8X7BR09_9ARAC|nr:hypothetical protein TNIN_103411 [Trichonephila inaurata madagascariensis]GFY39035.1 hypothetical protein TNIN_103421 [Trichonephila inaurata madagascariensis]